MEDDIASRYEDFKIDDPKQKLKERLNIFFDQNIRITPITTDKLIDSFILYENFNARRTQLSSDSLIKNLILRYGIQEDNYRKSTSDKWEEIIKKVPSMRDFVRYYWNSKNRFTTHRQLYIDFSDWLNDKNDDDTKVEAHTFVENELVNEVDPYLGLIDDEKIKVLETSNSNSIVIKKIAQTLFRLKLRSIKTFIPGALAIKRVNETCPTISDDVKNKILLSYLELVENTYFHQTILDKNPNKYEKFFAAMAYNGNAKGIYQASTLEEIKKEIKELAGKIESSLGFDAVNEKDFEKNLQDYFIGHNFDNEIAKSILYKVASNNFTNNSGTSLTYLLDTKLVQLEHILPQKIKDTSNNYVQGWEDWSDFAHGDNKFKLGNMLLLASWPNNYASNGDFKYKLDIYKNKTGGELQEFIDWVEKIQFPKEVK